MNRSSARRPCAGRPGVERRTAWSRFGFDAAALSRPTAPVREILNLLGIILPVFLLIGVGVALRRLRWLTPEADPSLLRISVNLLFPCLIFQAVVGNAALREPGNLVWPALLGFGSMGLGWLAGWWTARAIGLERGRGLRTFAFTVGFYNYGYMAIPLVKAQFGPGTLGVLFVFNTGIEMAIWTVGILLLAGGSLRQDWRKIFNAPAVSLVLAVALNALQATPPAPVRATVDWLAGCAVPLGLVLIGAVLDEHLHDLRSLLAPRIVGAATLLRLGVLPVVFLAAAKWLPVSTELKQVIIVQAAMPAGVFPIVLARHYGGQPLTAAQIVVGTTLAALVLIPLWISFGLAWVAP